LRPRQILKGEFNQMTDLMDLHKNMNAVNFADDRAGLQRSVEASREAIGKLLLSSTIDHIQHAELYTHLYNVWIVRRLAIEQSVRRFDLD
jgi:hypothetical protein